MDYQDKESDANRTKRIRELMKAQKARGNNGEAEEIEIKILKNRNGKAGTSEALLYTPRYNHYEEQSEFIPVDGEAAGSGWMGGGSTREPGSNPAKKRRPL